MEPTPRNDSLTLSQMDPLNATPPNPTLFVRKPNHKWFHNSHQECEEWYGPFDTLDETIQDAIIQQTEYSGMVGTIWIAQGRPSTKKERDEFAVDWKWWVEGNQAMAFNIQSQPNQPIQTQIFP